jgi:hypothetical protein
MVRSFQLWGLGDRNAAPKHAAFSEEAAGRCEDFVVVDLRGSLEGARVRHGDFGAADPFDGGVEFGEAGLLNARRDLGGNTEGRPSLLNAQHPVRLADGVGHSLHVERAQAAQVDNLGADAFGF